VLFDLRGKRKRVVQVSYVLLAALFLLGFVGFGIGGGGNSAGGIFDAIGLGGGSSGGSLSGQYDDQIDNANEQLAKNPNDTAALLKLSKYEFYKAKYGITTDPNTGVPSVSEDAHTELGNSVDAWEKYLKVNKGKPNPAIAAQIVQAYYFLGDAQGAAQAQRIVAEDQPSSGTYGQLAAYLYFTGDISGGDQAASKAEAEAPKSQRSQVKQQLEQIRQQAVKAKKQQAKAQKKAPSPTTPGASPLQSPLGGTGTAP
jgi:tetratricopeptide (TPR) repeat protein